MTAPTKGRAGAGTPGAGFNRGGGKPTGRSTAQKITNSAPVCKARPARGWRPVEPPPDFSDYGIELPTGAAGEVRVACPVCGPSHRHPHDKVVAVNTVEGVWYCHRCGWRGSLRLRRVPDPVRFAPPPPPPPPDQKKAERLARIWRESAPLTDPGAEIGVAYLRARGLEALVSAEDLPAGDVLRFHASLPYFESGEGGRRVGEYPCLLAAVTDSAGALATLHRTWLAADGSGKAPVASPKKLCSPPRVNALRGAAIRLYAATDRLAVAEGIETALAVRVLTALPAWSCGSAHGLGTVGLPAGLAELVIGADNDPNGVGERAAHALAQRAQRAGVGKVTVTIPKRVGDDWLDVLNRRAAP